MNPHQGGLMGWCLRLSATSLRQESFGRVQRSKQHCGSP